MKITFTDIAYGGDAVGRDPESGLAVFAWPGIAGEVATVEVTSRRPSMLRGLVTDVHEPSPDRIAPPCPYFGECGGCQWQHMSYPAQVATKHNILQSQLTRLGGISDVDAVLKEPIPSPQPFGYRNSSQFAIHPQERALAYHKRGGHDLLAIAQCPISNEGINATIPMLNTILVGALVGDEVGSDKHGLMRVNRVAIRSSENTGQVTVVFHTEAENANKARAAARSGKRRGEERPDDGPEMEVTTGHNPLVYLARREVRRAVNALSFKEGTEDLAITAIEIMSDGTVNLLGETKSVGRASSDIMADTMTGTLLRREDAGQEARREGPPLGSWLHLLGGIPYWVPPGSFFQVNTEASELLLQEVMSHVPARLGMAVDAHAGVGTFTLHLAKRATHVTGLESDKAAIAGAQWTARANGIANVAFRTGRAELLLPRLPETDPLDLVLLDPPRSGCHPALLAEIARRKVPRIIYISCDPSTLARDIKSLSRQYRLVSARAIDLFPQTFHIETVAVLERLA